MKTESTKSTTNDPERNLSATLETAPEPEDQEKAQIGACPAVEMINQKLEKK